MPIDVAREIAYLRNNGDIWTASALQRLQDGLNESLSSAVAASQPSAVAKPKLAIFQEPVLAQPPPPARVSPAPTSIVNTAGVAIGTGSSILVLTANSSISSIVTVLSNITTALAQVLSVTVPTKGGYVKVLGHAVCYNTGPSDASVQLQVWKGDNTGTKLYDTGPNGVWVLTGSKGVPWTSPELVDSSPAASQLYTIYAAISAGGGQLDNIALTAENAAAA